MKSKIIIIVLIFSLYNANSQSVIHLNKEGGIYYIENVKVNDVPMKMVYDTGASTLSLSITEARQMLKHGQLKSEDFIDVEAFQVANGDIEIGYIVNIGNW